MYSKFCFTKSCLFLQKVFKVEYPTLVRKSMDDVMSLRSRPIPFEIIWSVMHARKLV